MKNSKKISFYTDTLRPKELVVRPTINLNSQGAENSDGETERLSVSQSLFLAL